VLWDCFELRHSGGWILVVNLTNGFGEKATGVNKWGTAIS
jgi:hypothetical protein